MANATKTATATATAKGKATPAATKPTQAQGTTVNGVALPAPTGPLYVANAKAPAWGKVQPGSHRAYAQAVFAAVTKALPQGAALNQYKAALVGNVLPEGHPQRNVPAPTHGWAKHNMPTWARGQGWLVEAPTK